MGVFFCIIKKNYPDYVIIFARQYDCRWFFCQLLTEITKTLPHYVALISVFQSFSRANWLFETLANKKKY